MSETVSNAPRFSAPLIPSDSPESIDRSLRLPVTVAAGGASKWLLFGLLFLLVAALQRHQTDLFSSISWLTHGRLWAAGQVAVVYGFGLQAAFAAILWVSARLNRNRFPFPVWATIGIQVWNIGVLAGVIGILAGDSAGLTLLEMPRYAAPFLFVGFGLVAVLCFHHFHRRSVRETYPTQWYFIGALLWWPWSFSIAEALLVIHPVRGVVQAAVHGWYLASLFGLFFIPVALGLIFYFVPKLIERPLYSRQIAIFSFWTLAFITPWTGLVAYAAGPLPAWLKSLSFAFNFMMIVPVAATAWNYHLTIKGSHKAWKQNPILSLAGLSMVVYLLTSLLQLALSFPAVNEVVAMTQFSQASGSLILYGVFGLVALGTLYYIVPRVWNVAWPHPGFVKLHVGIHVLGLILLLLATAVGGVVQGFALNDPNVPFEKVIRTTQPFLNLHTLAFAVLFLGNGLFLVNLSRLVVRTGWTYCKSSALWVAAPRVTKSEVAS